MNKFKSAAISVATVTATAFVASMFATTSSSAADLPPMVSIPPEITPQSYGGWYLRGDIGYAETNVRGVSYFQGPTQTGEFEEYDIDSTWMIGGGIGYQINDWFRVDGTLNYFSTADFDGSSAQNVSCSDGTIGAICSYSDNASVQVTTLLANSYIDLGTWQGLTPYVGVGIGGALVHWSELDNVESHTSGNVPGTLAVDVHSKSAGWRFAYGLHAGASYDLSANLKLDAGYSYTHISEGEMFGFGADSGFVGTQGYHDEMEVHAFRVGLRYALY